MFRKKGFIDFATYAIALFLSISIFIGVGRLWRGDFSVPLSFEGDALFYQALIKGSMENGWILHNKYLGMPTGLELHDLPMADNLHFALIKFISFFAPTSAAALNIFSFLTFPLVTLTALFVFRSLHLSRPSSVAASLLFTFLPYHFFRLAGHMFLAAYYAVPLAILIVLWAFAEEPIFARYDEIRQRLRLSILNRKALLSIAVCFIVASAGIYYAFFTCFFLLVAVLSHLLARHKLRAALSGVILILLIVSGVFLNLLPNFTYWSAHGPNTQVANRLPGDAEIYGLKLTQLVLPAEYHRIADWRDVRARYNRNVPLVNENRTATLGIVGSLGFVILLVQFLFRRKSTSGEFFDVLRRLGNLNLFAILLGTVGGLGSLISTFITPQIRGYNRISVYIAFFSLAAFFLSLEALSRQFKGRKTSNLMFHSLLACILTLGILDQSPHFLPTKFTDRPFIESYRQEADFIHRIEAAMPPEAMIFQLPYVPCPEHPPVTGMKDYEHLRAYLYSKSLRWSYGAMKGRRGDLWQKAVAEKPVDEFVALLSLSGFQGVYVDRFGYPDKAAALEGNLSKLLDNQPLVSPDKRLSFFNISAFNQKTPEQRLQLLSSTLLPVWGEGFSGLEKTPQGSKRSFASEGWLYIYNLSNRPERATLEMNLATEVDKFSPLRIESSLYSGDFNVNADGTRFLQTITVPPGTAVMKFKGGDIRIRVTNFHLKEGQKSAALSPKESGQGRRKG
jgi:phosphoglycerol transferase